MGFKILKGRYAGSYLGLWWAVLTPVILAFSINFVFKGALKTSVPGYVFFVLAGIIPWLFFSNAASESAQAFRDHSGVMRQAVFPRECVPLAVVYAQSLNFCIGLLCLLPVFSIANPRIIPMLWVVPFLLFCFVVFITGFAFILSAAGVFFRDLQHFLSIFLTVWFWLTPVFYPVESIASGFRIFVSANPLTYYVVFFQKLLCEGALPSAQIIVPAVAFACVSCVAGYGIFIINESQLLKRI